MISKKMSGVDGAPKAVCDQVENDVSHLALDGTSTRRRGKRNGQVCTENNPEVVKVCPSPEELQWKPPNPAMPAAASCFCPVEGCRQLEFEAAADLLKHVSDFHPYLDNTRNLGKVCL